MNEHKTKLGPGQIQFHQWCEPPLETGDYTLTVNQKVAELKTKEGYKQEFRFSVAGPRFSLSPADVYSVYPPKGQTGDFANTIPHLVFTRRTLPWERTLVPGTRAKNDRRPWMALLVFSAEDFATQSSPNGVFPDLKSRKVSELIAPETGVVGPRLTPDAKGNVLPRNGLAAYEKEDDHCNTIDLPWQLFQSVVPSEKDMTYLAHVREVNTGNKETFSLLADGWFSVVVANRFPQPAAAKMSAVENRAYLVSLEGMQDYLPGSGKPAANKPVRLAVLSSWSFHCRKEFTFITSIKKLKVSRFCVPWHGEKYENLQDDAEKQVYTACELGYTALNHNTRLGEKNVSWYRGPLVPLYISRQSNYGFLPAADAAVRYNPLDGMMDVTYAAAFQLGRLLALQDRYFAAALYAYRNRVRSQINDVLGRKRVHSALGGSADGEENQLMSTYLGDLNPKKLTRKTWAKAKTYEVDRGEVDKAKPDSGALKLTTEFDLTIPGNICQWLARLILLYRVPFTYLVADERMLPPNSMAFFYLDPGWLKCLMEGACSVGRSNSRDELVDKNLRDSFFNLAIGESANVRTGTPAGQDAYADHKLTETELNWPTLTGFLMRSPVVEGWQGLEMKAWNAATQQLVPYRIDRLAPDIMLCIFKDKVERIEIKQPPEGMHFGASPVDGGGYTRLDLRRLNDQKTPGNNPGDKLQGTTETPIPLRPVPAKRVVDIAALVVDLKGKLNKKGARDEKAEFTSAEFGVEMVESPGRAIFDVRNPEKNRTR